MISTFLVADFQKIQCRMVLSISQVKMDAFFFFHFLIFCTPELTMSGDFGSQYSQRQSGKMDTFFSCRLLES